MGKNLTQCTAKLMEMLRDKYISELIDLDKEIETLRINENQYSSNAEFKKKKQEWLQHLGKYNKNVLMRKDQKFYQDKLAFSGGYAYRWQKGGFLNKRGFPPRKNTQNYTTIYKSDSDISISSSTVSSQKPQNKTSRSSVKGRAPRRGNGVGNTQGGTGSKKQTQDDILRVVTMNQGRIHKVTW